jgi:hypothetical protein
MSACDPRDNKVNYALTWFMFNETYTICCNCIPRMRAIVAPTNIIISHVNIANQFTTPCALFCTSLILFNQVFKNFILELVALNTIVTKPDVLYWLRRYRNIQFGYLHLYVIHFSFAFSFTVMSCCSISHHAHNYFIVILHYGDQSQ